MCWARRGRYRIRLWWVDRPTGRSPSDNPHFQAPVQSPHSAWPDPRRTVRSREPRPSLPSSYQLDKHGYLLCDDLSGDKALIAQIEHVKSDILGQISKIDLLIRTKSQLLDLLTFYIDNLTFSGDPGHSAHHLVSVDWTVAEVSTHRGIPHDFSYVFHGVWPVVSRHGTWLAHRVDVSIVLHWRGR